MTKKKPAKSKKPAAKVFHAELWGRRDEKYDWLRRHCLETTCWQELRPAKPFYLFVPHDEQAAAAYHDYPSVCDIFSLNSVGIVTARDKLTIRWTPEEVWQTVRRFVALAPEEAREEFALGKDARDWKVELAQQDLRRTGLSRERIVPILYRPFDVRYTYYTGHSRGFHCRPRPEVMKNMLSGENLALVLPRRVEHQGPWRHALVTSGIVEHVAVSLKTIDYVFPLCRLPAQGKNNLQSQEGSSGHSMELNLGHAFLEEVGERIDHGLTPQRIFSYIYAVVYAPRYRENYASFLRIDFPRIPFTADADLFEQMAALGGRLVDLHLLRSAELDPPLARFEGQAPKALPNGTVAGGFPKYDSGQERVYVNEGQYFAPVPPQVWEYWIGGYQVCEKWLKDRRRRTLSLEEIQTCCRIVTALKKTLEIQSDLDKLYPEVERNVVSFLSKS